MTKAANWVVDVGKERSPIIYKITYATRLVLRTSVLCILQAVFLEKPYPLAHCVTCNNFSKDHKSYLTAIIKVVEPKYFHQAVIDPN